jgi:hypothetical protein
MKSSGYPNALSVRRHQRRVALYLWNMSPSSCPLLGRDYTCIHDLYTRCLAFQDHPTFYSNIDIFSYQPGECCWRGNMLLMKEAKSKYINKNNIPIAKVFLFSIYRETRCWSLRYMNGYVLKESKNRYIRCIMSVHAERCISVSCRVSSCRTNARPTLY